MKYLLIMPRLIQHPGEGYVFPLGLAYISSSLKKAGHLVMTMNLNHLEGDVRELVADQVRQHGVDVVGTGGLSPQYHMIRAVLEGARLGRPEVVTIVGGGIISAEPAVAMTALELADFGVIGEGEVTICELAHALENDRPVATVKGVVYKEDGHYRLTEPREEIKDIDSIPWPDYDGFNVQQYLELPSAGFGGVGGERLLCLMASRSCPYRCTFCFHTNGFRYRQRSLDDFFAELDHVVKAYDVKHISLADELFAPNLDRAREFCRRIKNYNLTWFADFRVDMVTPELLQILKDSGLGTMFFGLESADNRILKSMRKGITVETIETTLRHVNEAGIPMFGCFIFGDVEETYETALNTLNWWRTHAEHHIHLTFLKPFPGSEVYRFACQSKIIPDPVQYLRDGCPQVNISKMSAPEFAAIAQQIAEANNLNSLDDIELLRLHEDCGREDIAGTCPGCGTHQVWNNVRLFSIDYLYCRKCGRKYPIPCPPAVVSRIEYNADMLLEKYGKLAIWGMTTSVMELIEASAVLRQPGVFPVDISLTKASLSLHGKKINLPDIINTERIPAVVVAVPSHAGQIVCQIRENHPVVQQIIDLGDLIAPA